MSTARIGSTLYIAAIVAFIALMAWLFADKIDEQRNPNRDVATRSAPDGAAEVVLKRNRAGHYVATGTLNTTPAEFMLDTGATDVAVSGAVARRAGLERGPAIRVATANGMTTAYATVIDAVRLGDIVERDVRATIVPNMGEIEVLLGMSFLTRLDFAQQGDTLVLRSRRDLAL
ncbi:MAG: retropepsin-like aspartic protease family protein [Gammaproteobacteria bacterium]